MDALFAGPWGPVLIFFLRIGDVSLSTLRILLAMRNQKMLVPLIGVAEVTIWIFAVGNAIRHLESPWHVLGYALGFATGSMVGMWIEEKLAIGLATMQIISRKNTETLAEALRALGCGVTEFEGSGREGPVEVIYTVVQRRRIRQVLDVVERWDPDAFITVSEPREIRRGWMHGTPRRRLPVGLRMTQMEQEVAEKQMPHREGGTRGVNS
jgi:uncharacterized protein YebE (UPF0316 family)